MPPTDRATIATLLDAITDADVADARSRPEPEVPAPPSAPGARLESTALAAPWPDLISQKAHDLIVRWETGGRAYYDQIIKAAPVWPGFSSGITIGCGYDLGYHSEAAFRADWGGRIGKAAFERLLPAIGFRTIEPLRAQKVAQAHAFIAQLADIRIPWDMAMAQFDAAKMPDLVRQLYGALDHLDRLHPHCRGALLSLTFNRGPAFHAEGDRYLEMRAIAARCTAGGAADFAAIPDLIRAMKRIWGENSSLSRRRETEAQLFEFGLAEAGTAAAIHALAA